MTTAVHQAWRRARRRRIAIDVATGLPIALALAAPGWRLQGVEAAVPVLLSTLLASAGIAIWRARRLDRQWLVRRLDLHPAAQDSADLLFAAPDSLNPLQQRQRARVDAALRAHTPDLRPDWPRRRLLLAWGSAAAVIALALAWPSPTPTPPPSPTTAATTSATPAVPPQLQSTQLQITAPAYTAQAVRTESTLDAQVPVGSRLQWSLRFSAPPTTVELQFHDGQRVALTREGGQWTAAWTADRSALYRVHTEPAMDDPRLYRIDALPDQPPTVRVIHPDQTLVAGAPGQREWPLRFEAADDYAVAANAELRVTVTEGSGENIRFREHRFALAGTGPAHRRRFARTLDPVALGAAPGSDVIAQLQVRDNRRPTAQTAHSASLILRMPSEAEAQRAELEGMVKTTLPAYFRSQRQIIIDAEALIRQRPQWSADEFVKRADSIGVDQRILRLRYGQFLGEESEGAPKPLPTSDAPTGDHAADPTPADDAHDHGPEPAASPVFGSETDLLAEYGHTHDHAEAATLLDPQTRATLKAALDQMWSSEGELRQGRPEQALPYAHKALAFIKEVQQAERIYLARVGPDLPPIDETRRLGGDRDGLASRTLPVAAAEVPDPSIVAVWQQLADPGNAPDLDALTQWLQHNQSRLSDPLSLAAAIEEWRVAPQCEPCRQRLRAQLWRVLLRPPPQVSRRAAPDDAGQAYLDALEDMP